MNVLIVEDDPMIASELAHAVAAARHQVAGIVSSRSAALEVVARAPVDAALVDLHLADGMTGLALAEALEERRIAVAILTGYGGSLQEAAREARPILDKPYYDGAVRKTLDRLAAVRHAHTR